MEFFQLLWTAVAILIHWVQSSGLNEVTSLRYCLIHWFFRSICLWVECCGQVLGESKSGC
jgi:hypothetical protein